MRKKKEILKKIFLFNENENYSTFKISFYVEEIYKRKRKYLTILFIVKKIIYQKKW